MSGLRDDWRALPRLERAGWCAVLGCLLLAWVAPAAVRALSPPLAVAAAYRSSHVFFSDFAAGAVAPGHVDPWGHPWLWRAAEPSDGMGHWVVEPSKRYVFYSAGPNGLDEGARGDDVVHRHVPGAGLAAWVREVLAALALIVLWLLRGPGARAPRSPRQGVEVARALLVASGPAALSAGLVLWATYQPWFAGLAPPGVTAVPLPVAALGSAVLPWVLLGLALRLRKTPPEEEETSPAMVEGERGRG